MGEAKEVRPMEMKI